MYRYIGCGTLCLGALLLPLVPILGGYVTAPRARTLDTLGTLNFLDSLNTVGTEAAVRNVTTQVNLAGGGAELVAMRTVRFLDARHGGAAFSA
eukprot:5695870-Pleurochrysis_carterae.AAC.1